MPKSEHDKPDIPAAELIDLVRQWRRDETLPVLCPACAAPGLDIADRSARPYREWYALSCKPCGFSQTVGVALAAPVPGS